MNRLPIVATIATKTKQLIELALVNANVTLSIKSKLFVLNINLVGNNAVQY